MRIARNDADGWRTGLRNSTAAVQARRPPASPAVWLGGGLVVALVLRLVAVALHGGAAIDMDGADYVRVAQNLAAGHGPISLRGQPMLVFAPLYSWLIAALIRIGVPPEGAALGIAVGSGIAFVAALYALAATLYGRRTAGYAALLGATLPIAVSTSTTAIAEAPFAAAATTGLLGLVRLLRTWSARDAALCGAGFGVAYLLRPEGILFALTAFAVAAVAAVAQRKSITPVAVLAAVAVACAIPALAQTYAISGHVALEGKSALNFGLAQGLRSGAPYLAVADAVDATGRPVGPEIDPRYYSVGAAPPAPTLPVRVELMLGAAGKHVRDVANTFKSRDYGGGVLVVLALAGLASARRSRQRVRDELVLLAYLATGYVALTTVWHFWARYGAIFLPVAIVLAAHGCTRLHRWTRHRLRFDAGLAALALTVTAFVAIDVAAARTVSAPLERATGAWIAADAARAPRIVDVVADTAFYAGGIWSPLPYADERAAVLYLRRLRPDYVVLDSSRAADYPPLARWFAQGLPATLGRRVDAASDDHGRSLVVYRFTPDLDRR